MTKTPQNTLTNETIQSLREKNYKVRVAHQRLAWNRKINLAYPLMVPQWIVKQNPHNWDIVNGGGVTIVQVTSPEGKNAEGIAVCVEENFNRKVGIRIALQRALAEL